MWSRVELKTQAKNLLKLNYWLFVLGGIILSFVTTGHISGSGGLKLNYNANSKNISDISNSIGDAFSSDQKDITYDFKDSINEITGSITPCNRKDYYCCRDRQYSHCTCCSFDRYSVICFCV